MEITVTGKHLEITDAIRQYAEGKAARLPRYYDRVSGIEITLDRAESHGYDVQVIVHVDGHEPFVARAKTEDLYAGIDDSTDKMERQLTDFKEKLRNRKHSSSH
jgi:putative sigma-54 modulation protein